MSSYRTQWMDGWEGMGMSIHLGVMCRGLRYSVSKESELGSVRGVLGVTNREWRVCAMWREGV